MTVGSGPGTGLDQAPGTGLPGSAELQRLLPRSRSPPPPAGAAVFASRQRRQAERCALSCGQQRELAPLLGAASTCSGDAVS